MLAGVLLSFTSEKSGLGSHTVNHCHTLHCYIKSLALQQQVQGDGGTAVHHSAGADVCMRPTTCLEQTRECLKQERCQMHCEAVGD